MLSLFFTIDISAQKIDFDNDGIISFDKIGAVYHKNEKINVTIKFTNLLLVCKEKLSVDLMDIDGKSILKWKVNLVESPAGWLGQIRFKINKLGYYYIKYTISNGFGSIIAKEEGFGVIPDVTLTKKDFNSQFGVCGHYSKYKDGRVADIQQQLGIAWLRDKAEWKNQSKENTFHDPFIDYLDEHNISWLPILDYVNANNGVQNADSIWRWDKDVSDIKKYVEVNKGKLSIYESQNEPSNFAGWSKRWPHPQNQKWRPQGWGVPFTDLLKQMYDSIKSVDPSIRLMWPGEDEWTEYFVKNRNAAPYIDLTAIHPYAKLKKYPETEDFANGFYSQHKKMLVDLHVPTEMWVTEIGWSTFKKTKEETYFRAVTEKEQAAFLFRAYLLHLYYGATKVFWYELVDEPFEKDDPESSFGLLKFNAMLTIKPSAVAFSNLVNNYRYATPLGKYTGESGTYGFAYTDKKANPLLCIWRQSDFKDEILNLKYTKKLFVTDIYGREFSITVSDAKASLPLSISPLTIRGFDIRDFNALYYE